MHFRTLIWHRSGLCLQDTKSAYSRFSRITKSLNKEGQCQKKHLLNSTDVNINLWKIARKLLPDRSPISVFCTAQCICNLNRRCVNNSPSPPHSLKSHPRASNKLNNEIFLADFFSLFYQTVTKPTAVAIYMCFCFSFQCLSNLKRL